MFRTKYKENREFIGALSPYLAGIGTYQTLWLIDWIGLGVDMLLYMYCTLHCSAQAVPVYLAEPDHEPETELGYQETVVDNVVEACH